ncbi:MAG TPA: hypothetical protein VMF13_03025 [Luteitalea sp.]|nr:hypothetical protein [Luteitalea sp.]
MMPVETRADADYDARMTNDPLDERPDEKARREQSPDEKVEESEAIVENEGQKKKDMPPLREPYGGPPDERSTPAG